MGRSFDRGGQNRKERERGKRRTYRQAEREREAREAVSQQKRMTAAAMARSQPPRMSSVTPAAHVADMTPRKPVVTIEQKHPGLFARMFGRLFKKSA